MFDEIKLLLHLPKIKEALLHLVPDLKIEICWVHHPFKTIHLSGSFNQKQLNAWGTSHHEALALGKAMMEFIERMFAFNKPQNWVNLENKSTISHDEALEHFPILHHFLSATSGQAIHLDPIKARKSALAEVLERHTITKALFEHQPWSRINNHLFHIDGPLNHTVAVARHPTPQGGHIYGTAANLNLNKAILSAQAEVAPLQAWIQNPSNLQSMIMDLEHLNSPQIIQLYHLSHSFNFPLKRDRSSEAHTSTNKKLTEADFWWGTIPLPAIFSSLGLHLIRCFSPKIQPFSFKPLNQMYINPQAITPGPNHALPQYNIVA